MVVVFLLTSRSSREDDWVTPVLAKKGGIPKEEKPMRVAVFREQVMLPGRRETLAGSKTLKWRFWTNHKRVSAIERLYGSAGGNRP